MNPTSPILLAVLFALALGVPACGGARAGVETNLRRPLTAAELHPLGEGYIWTYDIDTGTGVPTLGIRRVIRASPPRYVLQMDGERSEHTYELREGGLYDAGENVWVLREPIVPGSEWPTRGGRTARVTAVDQAVDVPAGHFEGCVEVRETGSETGPDLRTVYCPEQGPVIIESHQALALAARGGITVRAVLRAPVQRGLEDVEQPEEIPGPGGR
jgi:hypothetical protein